MPTMHCIERPNSEPLFYVTTPQYAGILTYADFRMEAAMIYRLLLAGELTADQFPHVQVIPPYGDPYTVVLNFTREPNANGVYLCHVIDPEKLKAVTIDDVPLMFEVRP